MQINQRNFSSVKTIQASFPELTKEQAKQIRALVKGELSPDSFDTVKEHKYISYLSKEEKILEALNEILDGHGVEGFLLDESNQSSGYVDYVNMGNTYANTVLLTQGKFMIGCWGDLISS